MEFKNKYLKYKTKYLKLKELSGGNRLTHDCYDYDYFERNYDKCMKYKSEGAHDTIFIIFDFNNINLGALRPPDEGLQFWNILQLLNINPENIYMCYANKQIKKCFDANQFELEENIISQIKDKCDYVNNHTRDDKRKLLYGESIYFRKPEQDKHLNLFYKYAIKNKEQFEFLGDYIEGTDIKPIIEKFIERIILKLETKNKNIVMLTGAHGEETSIELRGAGPSEVISHIEYYNLFMKPFYDYNKDIVMTMIHLHCSNISFTDNLNKHISDLIDQNKKDIKYIGIVDKVNYDNFIIFKVTQKINSSRYFYNYIQDYVFNMDELSNAPINFTQMAMVGYDENDLDYIKIVKKYTDDLLPLIILINYIKKKLKINLTILNIKSLIKTLDFNLYFTTSFFHTILSIIDNDKDTLIKTNTWDDILKKVFYQDHYSGKGNSLYDSYQTVEDLILSFNTNLTPNEIATIRKIMSDDFNKFLQRGSERIIIYSKTNSYRIKDIRETQIKDII